VVLGLIASSIVGPTSVASAAQTVTLSAGAESVGGDVQLNTFAPLQVTINVGDTVTWRWVGPLFCSAVNGPSALV